jgi:hypothetical protein
VPLLGARLGKPRSAADAGEPKDWLTRVVENGPSRVVVKERAGGGREEAAARVEGPVRLGEQLKQRTVLRGAGKCVVDGPGRGEEVASAVAGKRGAAGVQGQDVRECVGVEGLRGWLVGKALKGCFQGRRLTEGREL